MPNPQNKIPLRKLTAELCPNGVEYKKLGDIATESGERNKNRDVTEVRTVTSSSKLVRTSDYFDREITSEDTSSYKVVREGMFVYNPARINIGSIAFSTEKEPVILSPMYVAFSVPQKILLNEFLLYFLKSQKGMHQIVGKVESGARFRFPFASLSRIKVPVPPIEVQREIVRILDKFTDLSAFLETELIARKKQYEYYREKLLTFTDDVPRVNICEIFEIRNGYTPSKAKSDFWENGTIPWFVMEDIRKNGRVLSDSSQHITPEAVKGKGLFKANSIIMATSATIGEHALITVDHLSNQRFINLKIRDAYSNSTDIKYLFYYAFMIDEWCKKNTSVSSFATVDMAGFKKLEIPLPPLAEQKRIADILDRFDLLCNDLTSGIPAEIAARKKQYEYYRDRLLTFREKIS